MNPSKRSPRKLEDAGLRTRKKIHECNFNEAFESERRFTELDDQSLTFWYKTTVAGLFREAAPPETPDESVPGGAPVRLVSADVRTAFALDELLAIEITFQPEPTTPEFRQSLSLALRFALQTKNGAEVPKSLKGAELCFDFKVFLMNEGACKSKRKCFFILGREHGFTTAVRSGAGFDNTEELALELQVDLSQLAPEPEEDARAPAGLVNLGVTCYMNSYLQTIFHLRKFRYFVNRLSNEGDEDSFVFQLQRLFCMLERSRAGSASPRALVGSFGWNVRQVFTQQDVQEFSFMFLDALERQTLKLGHAGPPISRELFQGELESFVSCKAVDCESRREEVFTDLQLALRDSRGLEEALERYLGMEELAGENAYETERFGRQEAVKGVRLRRLPKVLVFHLGRFQFDLETGQNAKLLSEFAFPETVDMAPFVGARPRREGAAPADPYRLFGVFVHIGFHAHSGHYVVYLKLEGGWFEFNDELVRPVTFELVRRRSFGGRQTKHAFDARTFKLRQREQDAPRHAYVLVYVRAADYEDVVFNGRQRTPFPANVEASCRPELERIAWVHRRDAYHRVFAIARAAFLGRPTGRGSLFFTRALFDGDERARFKEAWGAFAKFEVRRSVLSEDFEELLRAALPAGPGERSVYFVWHQGSESFVPMDLSAVAPNFTDEFKQFVYVHRVPAAAAPGPRAPCLMIWKAFDAAANSLTVAALELVGEQETFGGVEAAICAREGAPCSVLLENFQTRRLEDLDDFRRNTPIADHLAAKKQFAVSFAFGRPRSDETANALKALWALFKNCVELQLRDASTGRSFRYFAKSGASLAELFAFLRGELGLSDSRDPLFELSVLNKAGHMVKLAEGGRSLALPAGLRDNQVFFSLVPAATAGSRRLAAEASGPGQIPLKYLPYGALAELDLSALADLSEFRDFHPPIEEFLRAVRQSRGVWAAVEADIGPFAAAGVPVRLLDLTLFTRTTHYFRRVTSSRTLNNQQYFVLPVLELAAEKPADGGAPVVSIELRFVTGCKKALHSPVFFLARDDAPLDALLQTAEGFLCRMKVRNPENDDLLEPEYLRRNVRWSLLANDKEREVGKGEGLLLRDVCESALVVFAFVSTESFRNNIKINI